MDAIKSCLSLQLLLLLTLWHLVLPITVLVTIVLVTIVLVTIVVVAIVSKVARSRSAGSLREGDRKESVRTDERQKIRDESEDGKIRTGGLSSSVKSASSTLSGSGDTFFLFGGRSFSRAW
jgi:hypothetical protein